MGIALLVIIISLGIVFRRTATAVKENPGTALKVASIAAHMLRKR
jgi:hypothetical protein